MPNAGGRTYTCLDSRVFTINPNFCDWVFCKIDWHCQRSFGTDDGFVVSYKDIENDNDLIEPIMDFVSREEEIRQQLERVIPTYKRKAIIGAERLAEFWSEI